MPSSRQLGDDGLQAGVFALRERRLDARTGVVEDAHLADVLAAEALRGLAQVELDDFTRTGAHEEERRDVGASLEQLPHHAIELFIAVGHSREVAVAEDGGGEARFGEDHHAGGALQQMRAGARADDEEERVLHLAMQPHDAGEAAEDFALSALLEHGHVAAADVDDGESRTGHASTSRICCSCRRAARSLRMNCTALITYAA